MYGYDGEKLHVYHFWKLNFKCDRQPILSERLGVQIDTNLEWHPCFCWHPVILIGTELLTDIWTVEVERNLKHNDKMMSVLLVCLKWKKIEDDQGKIAEGGRMGI